MQARVRPPISSAGPVVSVCPSNGAAMLTRIALMAVMRWNAVLSHAPRMGSARHPLADPALVTASMTALKVLMRTAGTSPARRGGLLPAGEFLYPNHVAL